MNKINFNFHDARFPLLKRRILKQFIINLFKHENKELAVLDYVFCSDEYLLDLNKRFLNHHYFTDIITFSLEKEKMPIVGEVYISIDRVKENAKDRNLTTQDELLRVIFHGALHLCGYLDKTKADKLLMTKKEDYYLSLFAKVPRGT